jgi:DNA-binding IclR family transcriptional regulator
MNRAITALQLIDGAPIPSVAALAGELGIDRATAYRMLDDLRAALGVDVTVRRDGRGKRLVISDWGFLCRDAIRRDL